MPTSPVLKSWKEISAFLHVTVRTAQRWERELGLPVHRPRSKRGSAVLGFTGELRAWLEALPAAKAQMDPPAAGPASETESVASTYGGTLATDLLWKRPSRPVDRDKEVEILRQLSQQIARQDRQSVLDALVTHAMNLCKADSSGISLATISDTGDPVFRWIAASGSMQEHLGGGTPQNFSPCGVCLERNAPQLFCYPERFFTYLQDLGLPMTELLLIPFYADADCLGTVWVFCHQMRRKFDREDARILTSVTELVAAAFRVMPGIKSYDRPHNRSVSEKSPPERIRKEPGSEVVLSIDLAKVAAKK